MHGYIMQEISIAIHVALHKKKKSMQDSGFILQEWTINSRMPIKNGNKENIRTEKNRNNKGEF